MLLVAAAGVNTPSAKGSTMHVDLTPEEVRTAVKLAKKSERWAKSWPWVRWIVVSMGVLMLGVSIWGMTVAAKLDPRKLLADMAVQEAATSRPASMPVETRLRHLESDLSNTKVSIPVEIVWHMAFAAFWISTMVQLFFGGILVIDTLYKWNGHHTERLIARFLRAAVEESRPAAGEREGGGQEAAGRT